MLYEFFSGSTKPSAKKYQLSTELKTSFFDEMSKDNDEKPKYHDQALSPDIMNLFLIFVNWTWNSEL